VDDDVGAPLNRPAQVRRGHGVVDDQRDLGLVGDLGEGFDVDDVDERVAQRFRVKQLGVLLDGFAEILRVARVDEGGLDAELPQVHVQQRVRAAVQGRGRDDVVAGAAQREDGGDFGRLAGGGGQRRAPALDRRHAFLEHRHRRVGDARVDVAEGLQVEQAGGVLGGVEDERGGLVDRRGARAGGRIRDLPGVQAKRLNAELAVSHAPDSKRNRSSFPGGNPGPPLSRGRQHEAIRRRA
jgi:hypothetical protein